MCWCLTFFLGLKGIRFIMIVCGRRICSHLVKIRRFIFQDSILDLIKIIKSAWNLDCPVLIRQNHRCAADYMTACNSNTFERCILYSLIIVNIVIQRVDFWVSFIRWKVIYIERKQISLGYIFQVVIESGLR
jgi:hypothetical protein